LTTWRLADAQSGWRLEPVVLRTFGSEEFTWANLLYTNLSAVRVLVLYFPSRFESAADATVRGALRTFGDQTGRFTAVHFWDARDDNFSAALQLFHLAEPPAIVLAGGSRSTQPIDPDELYAISLSDAQTLADQTQLASAVNAAHEVMMRADPREITSYLRQQKATSLLKVIGDLAAGLRDELVKLKPKFSLPGGVSVQIG
jgi:hypothetical protein